MGPTAGALFANLFGKPRRLSPSHEKSGNSLGFFGANLPIWVGGIRFPFPQNKCTGRSYFGSTIYKGETSMRKLWIRVAAALMLALTMSAANALETVGPSCTGNGCKAGDGNTGGGACIGNFCSAGSAGTVGGNCIGLKCRAGNGGTAGGSCWGDGCTAGDGHTGGGNCYGKNCQAGHGGTAGGSCAGSGCKPGGNHGRVLQGSIEVPKNVSCCVAMVEAKLRIGGDIQMCNLVLSQGGGVCGIPGIQPASATPPNTLPALPTPLADIIKQTRTPPDPRCPFNCQAWNPASNSCVGAQMNVCN